MGSIHGERRLERGEYHKHKLGSDLNAAFSCAISGGFTTAGRMSGPDKANQRCKPRAVGFSPTPFTSPLTPKPLHLKRKARVKEKTKKARSLEGKHNMKAFMLFERPNKENTRKEKSSCGVLLITEEYKRHNFVHYESKVKISRLIKTHH